MIRNGRILCVAPFCKRTAPTSRWPDCDEFICAKHWRGVGRRTKWLYRTVKRKLKRRPDDRDYLLLGRRIWERAKREAIEAAAGLS